MNDLSSNNQNNKYDIRITLLKYVEEPVDDLPSVIMCQYCWKNIVIR